MKKPKPVVNQSPLSYHRKHRLYDPSSGKEPIKVKVYLHMYVSHTEAYTNEAAAKYYLEWYANKPEIITEVEILLEECEMEETVDEIKRLRQINAELVNALKEAIDPHSGSGSQVWLNKVYDILDKTTGT